MWIQLALGIAAGALVYSLALWLFAREFVATGLSVLRVALDRRAPSLRRGAHVKVAYLVSRFPKLSETFIVDEILALERRGVEVELYSLARQARARLASRSASRSRALPRSRRRSRRGSASPSSPGSRARRARCSRSGRACCCEHWRSPRLLARSIATVAFASLHALHMQRCGVAHVHAHWATHPALAAWVVHRLTGLPYSFTAHADDLFVQQSMLREKARRAAFVVAISEYNRRFLTEQLGAAAPRIEVVHCGVATAELRPRRRVRAGGPFRIACVARLEQKKGQARARGCVRAARAAAASRSAATWSAKAATAWRCRCRSPRSASPTASCCTARSRARARSR